MNAVHQYDLDQDDEAHFKDRWCPMLYMVRCPGAEFLQNIVFTNVGNAQMNCARPHKVKRVTVHL